jgi:hypothetical protein
MRDFGISEILQLIGHQKKSGTLMVADKNRSVEILFDQGNIVLAKHEPARDEFDLGATLVRSGAVSPEQMASAKKEREETLEPLEQVLLKSEAIDLPGLKSMITLTQLETIYSLFLWNDGDYSFEQGPISYPQQWTQPISSEQVLMDGYRIKDEWPMIEMLIPNPGAKLSKQEGEFGPEDKLGPELKNIYQLVDGRRTVEDVVFLSRMGKFESMKLIKELVEIGRIRTAKAAAGEAERDVRAVLVQALAALVIIFGLLAVIMGSWRNLTRITSADLDSPGDRAREALWSWHKVDRAGAALSIFAALKGGYPETLKRLVQDGELDEDILETGFGPLEYRVEEGGRACRVVPPGRAEVKAPDKSADSGVRIPTGRTPEPDGDHQTDNP